MEQDCAKLGDTIRCYLVLSDIDRELSGFSWACQDMVACPVSTFLASMMITRDHSSENIGANKFFRFQSLHRWMGNISKIWPTCKIVFLLTIVISNGRIGRNQDMVNAIIAESTLDCIVRSYWLRAPYKGLLAPKYGRAENGWDRAP